MQNLSLQRRLEQFSILYDLCIESQKETIERMHKEHLQSLIETKKILKKAGEKRVIKRNDGSV